MDSLPQTDVEIGSIVSLGLGTNGVRDPILYQQHIKPQVYIPIHVTDATPISSSLRFKIAYQKAVVAANVAVRPEIRWMVDPDDFVRPMVYDPNDERWENHDGTGSSSSSAVTELLAVGYHHFAKRRRPVAAVARFVSRCEPPWVVIDELAARHRQPSQEGASCWLSCWSSSLPQASLRADAADLLPVRVGVTHGADSGPLYIAVSNGYFRDEGLDARLEFFDTETALAAAAAAGRIDIGAAALNASFFSAAAKHGFKFVASQISDQSGYPTDALLISKTARDAGLRGVKDLPHKRIALAAAGSGEQYSMVRIAARYGLDPHDLDLVWLKTPAREIAALSRGEVDAATLPFITALKLRDAGKGAAILRISDLAQRQQGVIFARAQTIEANRPLVEKFVRAYRRGVAEYDMTFQQRGDEGDVLPGPHFDDYLALIARQAKAAARAAQIRAALLRPPGAARPHRHRAPARLLAKPGAGRQARRRRRPARPLLHRRAHQAAARGELSGRRRWSVAALDQALPMRSNTAAMPWPTPMHMVTSA